MPEAWRIVKAKHAAAAFTGEGAAKTGGRWNSAGVPVVYASAAKSLAALETLVHLNPVLLFKYVIFRIEFEDRMIEAIPARRLPKGWRIQPPPSFTKRIGDNWVRASRSAVLAVPSVIISDELNYVLNPAHPDFQKIKVGKPNQFSFDARLLALKPHDRHKWERVEKEAVTRSRRALAGKRLENF